MVHFFDEMAQKLEFYAKIMIHVLDTSVFITICLNDFFQVCVTPGLHPAILLLLDVA